HPELGRTGRSLLGQEQAEFFARARAAGARGLYAPAMEVHHHVPAGRLTKDYYRRWWFWKGISRARVDAMHHRTELGLDLRTVPYIARAPRLSWGGLARSGLRLAAATARRDPREAARHEMHCVYSVGYVKACWTHQSASRLTAPPLKPRQETASVSR